MTDYTPLLHLPEVAPNQTQKEATINTALAILEAAMNDALAISLAAGNVTLNTDQFTKYFYQQYFGHTVARQVTIPSTARWFAAENLGTGTITFKASGAASSNLTIDLLPGKVGLIISDGEDVRFVVPDPTGGVGNLEDLSNVSGVATNGQVLRYVSADNRWEPWTIALAFLALTDTPSSYSGSGGKLLAVKSDGSGIEFVDSSVNVTDFLDLTDTPSSYSGAANRTVKVNSGGTALIFAQPKLTEASDYPANYTGAASKFLRVNSTPNAVIFDTLHLDDIVDGPGSPASGDELKYVRVKSDGSGLEYGTGTGGPDSFYQLLDTPSSYTGAALKTVRVNSGATGLEFHTPSFLDATDTPNSFTGATGKFLQVNAGETGLQYNFPKVSDLSDGPGSPQFNGLKVVRANSTGTFLEYRTLLFTDLGQVPSSFTGQANKFLRVKADESGLQFSSSSASVALTDLTDGPGSYSGAANKFVVVNSGATGFTFKTVVVPVNIGDLADVENATSKAQGDYLRWIDGVWQADPGSSSGASSLAQLTDVALASLVNGDILRYDSASGKFKNTRMPLIPVNLGDLANVEAGTGTPNEGDVLTYRDSVWQAEPASGGGGSNYLADLYDVDLSTNPPTDQQSLIYDALSFKWVPGAAVGSGGDETPVPVTIVQSASGRSAANSSTSITVTFATATTPGNAVVFLVNGYGGGTSQGVLSVSGLPYYKNVNSSEMVNNQQVGVLAVAVASGSTTYTINIASPNGGTNIYAMEVENLADIVVETFVPSLSSPTVSTVALARKGERSFLLFESDPNAGALNTYTSGLTLLYDAYAGSVNHSGSFFSLPDALIGKTVSATYSSTVSTPIGGVITLLSSRYVGVPVEPALGDLSDVDLSTGTPNEGDVLTYHHGVWNSEPLPPVVADFLDLTDTPDAYTDQALKAVRVKLDETGLEFYEPTLADLADIEITSASPSEDQVLSFSGGAWAPRTIREAGTYRGEYDFTISNGSPTFDSGFPEDFESANRAGWTIVSQPDSGVGTTNALKSRPIGADEFTSFFIDIYADSGFGIVGISGRHKVSSDSSTGYFKVLVDGVEKVSDSGNTGSFEDFDTGSLDDGHHRVEFRYIKTGGTVVGDDAVYISYASYGTLAPAYYKMGDIVDFSGARYVSLVDYPNSDPTDPTQWQPFGAALLANLGDVDLSSLPGLFPFGVRFNLAYGGSNWQPYQAAHYWGAWTGFDTYVFGDVVDYGSDRYFCLVDGTTDDPTVTDSWQIFGGSGGGGATSLGELSDVDLSTGAPNEGDVLTYHNGVWNSEPAQAVGTIVKGEVVNHYYGSNAGGQSITLGSTPAVGNWLVVVMGSNDFSAATAAGDWTRYDKVDDGASYLSVGIYYKKVVTGDTATITPTTNAASSNPYAVYEFKNLSAGFPAAFTAHYIATGGTPSPGSFSTTGTAEVLVTAFQRNTGIDLVVAGTTYDFNETSGHGHGRDVTSAGVVIENTSFTPTITYDGSGDQKAAVVLQVNLDSGIAGFTSLSDTPPSYAGKARKGVAVRSDETGLEFVDRTADVGTFTSGIPGNSELIFRLMVATAFDVPTTGHQGSSETNATGSSVFTFKKNGVSFGTATFAAAGNTATYSITATAFAAGDILSVTAPSSADATLADISLTLHATRH